MLFFGEGTRGKAGAAPIPRDGFFLLPISVPCFLLPAPRYCPGATSFQFMSQYLVPVQDSEVPQELVVVKDSPEQWLDACAEQFDVQVGAGTRNGMLILGDADAFGTETVSFPIVFAVTVIVWVPVPVMSMVLFPPSSLKVVREVTSDPSQASLSVPLHTLNVSVLLMCRSVRPGRAVPVVVALSR